MPSGQPLETEVDLLPVQIHPFVMFGSHSCVVTNGCEVGPLASIFSLSKQQISPLFAMERGFTVARDKSIVREPVVSSFAFTTKNKTFLCVSFPNNLTVVFNFKDLHTFVIPATALSMAYSEKLDLLIFSDAAGCLCNVPNASAALALSDESYAAAQTSAKAPAPQLELWKLETPMPRGVLGLFFVDNPPGQNYADILVCHATGVQIVHIESRASMESKALFVVVRENMVSYDLSAQIGNSAACCVTHANSANTLLFGTLSGHVIFLNYVTREVYPVCISTGVRVTAVCEASYTSDNLIIYIAIADGGVHKYDTGKVVELCRLHDTSAICLFADDDYLLLGCENWQIKSFVLRE